ncbi:Putative teichuronic acid biosynthesis glycosyltransferase TuaC [Anaerolineae bacterium]|nr:Putative teichuronic acid biosynthesis glycosyltransferase TuaC [Anaerolineae bacterium]
MNIDYSQKASISQVRVGFLVPSIQCGGAERWTLNLARFCDASQIRWSTCVVTQHWCNRGLLSSMASLMPTYYNHDIYQRGTVQRSSKETAIDRLLNESDIVIAWEFDEEMLRLADTRRVKVVNVAHRNSRITNFSAEHYLAAVSPTCRETFGVENAHRVKIILNGIDLNRCFALQSRKSVREQWGCSDDDLAIVCIGRLDKSKNLMALSRAVRGLGANTKGILYGAKIPDKVEADSLLAQMIDNTNGRIFYSESVEDIGSVLKAADVFFLPSYSEAFSLSLLEAWAAGVPVVATSVGIIPELEKQYGQLTIAIEPEAAPTILAEAIRRATREPLYRDIVLRAQKLILEQFNVLQMASNWSAYLKSIAACSNSWTQP